MHERGPLFDEALAELRSRPDAQKPLSRADLLRQLRLLASKEPSSEGDLAQLEAELFALGERVRLSEYCNEMPHLFWHFLSDADLRRGDATYAAQQRALLLTWAADWEAQHAT